MRHCGHTYIPEGMERLSVAMLCTEAANEIASLTASDAVAYYTSSAASAARTATLKKCAEIVRKHYPTLPT